MLCMIVIGGDTNNFLKHNGIQISLSGTNVKITPILFFKQGCRFSASLANTGHSETYSQYYNMLYNWTKCGITKKKNPPQTYIFTYRDAALVRCCSSPPLAPRPRKECSPACWSLLSQSFLSREWWPPIIGSLLLQHPLEYRAMEGVGAAGSGLSEACWETEPAAPSGIWVDPNIVRIAAKSEPALTSASFGLLLTESGSQVCWTKWTPVTQKRSMAKRAQAILLF